MSAQDVERLISRLEMGVGETTRRFRSGGVAIALGSVGVAALCAMRAALDERARDLWYLVPLCLAFGAALYWLSRVAARKSGPERAAPVLRALREAPERIRSIAHKETSDSRRIFVHQWIEIKTDDGRLFVRADDWRELIETLARRCTNATIVR